MPRQRHYYGFNHLHFITASTYRRARLFDSDRFRRQFLQTLMQLRIELNFKIIGYVLMPEHFHLLVWPSKRADPSRIVQSLKERTAKFILRNLQANRQLKWCERTLGRLTLPSTVHLHGPYRVWQRRFYDLNVWSEKKRQEKLNTMHGNHVKGGQVLAILENDDYRAQVASAKADLAKHEADLRKIINGARPEERREALASVNEAQAVMENARAEMERRQRLYRDGVVSREEADRYEREYKVAKARHDEAAQHYALLDNPAREEDRARGEADVALAKAQLDEARTRYQKTFIRSPIDGVVMRKYHRPGESVTNSSTSADPVVTLGNERVLRLRVDIDENDVAKVRLGDRAYVTADALGNRKFLGHVVRIGQEMGPKNTRTDEPTERVDKKILETLVQLDDGHELPIGLRVDSFILISQPSVDSVPGSGG